MIKAGHKKPRINVFPALRLIIFLFIFYNGIGFFGTVFRLFVRKIGKKTSQPKLGCLIEFATHYYVLSDFFNLYN